MGGPVVVCASSGRCFGTRAGGGGEQGKAGGRATRRGAPAVPQIWIVMENLKLLPSWNMWHGGGADARTKSLAVAPGMAQKGVNWSALILPRVR